MLPEKLIKRLNLTSPKVKEIGKNESIKSSSKQQVSLLPNL